MQGVNIMARKTAARRPTRRDGSGPALAQKVANDWVEENGYRVAAAASVPIPLPGAHTALCTAIEAYMIFNIAKIYGRDLSVGESIALIPALGGAVVVGKTVSSIAGEFLGWIPVAGWLAKGAVGGATAYGVGKAAVAYFESKHPAQPASTFPSVGLRDFVRDAMRELGIGAKDADSAADHAAKGHDSSAEGEDEEDEGATDPNDESLTGGEADPAGD